jgi:hypothetical protein
MAENTVSIDRPFAEVFAFVACSKTDRTIAAWPQRRPDAAFSSIRVLTIFFTSAAGMG